MPERFCLVREGDDLIGVINLGAVDAELRAQHGPGVSPWYLGELCDHLYASCPGLRRLGEPQTGTGALYPEAGDVCGWCLRVWRARAAKETADA